MTRNKRGFPTSRTKKQHNAYVTRKLEEALYMGIDWGKSDVGVALADGTMRIAYAHTTLDNGRELVKSLGKVIQEKGVKTVVLGISSPINRKSVEHVSEKLGEVLEQNYGVIVEYQNEMFTTKIAQRQLIERGVKHIERYDDQEAARIILQDWLDRETIIQKQKQKKNVVH